MINSNRVPHPHEFVGGIHCFRHLPSETSFRIRKLCRTKKQSPGPLKSMGCGVQLSKYSGKKNHKISEKRNTTNKQPKTPDWIQLQYDSAVCMCATQFVQRLDLCLDSIFALVALSPLESERAQAKIISNRVNYKDNACHYANLNDNHNRALGRLYTSMLYFVINQWTGKCAQHIKLIQMNQLAF